MDGFVIKRGRSYLTAALFWYEHDSVSSVYVFSREEVKTIIDFASNWDLKIESIISARYENGKTVLVEA